jgi:hypothetical protein
MSDERTRTGSGGGTSDERTRSGGGRADDEVGGEQPDFEGHRAGGNEASRAGGRADDEQAGDEPDFEGHRHGPPGRASGT